jgi:hypothetical protein
VEGLDGGFLHCPVHPLGLTVRPRVVGLGEAVLDAVFVTHPVEDVAAEEGLEFGVAAAVLGQVGEGHAVVREHGMDPVGEDLDDLAQERGTVGLGVGVEEADVGEFRDAVDREGHEQFAPRQAQLANIDVDVADLGLGEALALGCSLIVTWQARDPVAYEAAVQGAARQPGDGPAQAAKDIIQRQEGAPSELDDNGLLGLAEHGAARPRGAHGGVGRRPAATPLGDGLRVQPVAGGQPAGRLLRRLELGSNSRRRPG